MPSGPDSPIDEGNWPRRTAAQRSAALDSTEQVQAVTVAETASDRHSRRADANRESLFARAAISRYALHVDVYAGYVQPAGAAHRSGLDRLGRTGRRPVKYRPAGGHLGHCDTNSSLVLLEN